jgi:hypothetical protein
MSGATLFFFTAIWSAFVVFFDVRGARDLGRQFESLNYPYVMGVVTSSKVATHRGSKGSVSYSPDIHYRYTVDNRPYNASCLRFMSQFSDYNWATDTVAAHPAGSQIRVYFNPSDPQDALLSPDIEGIDLLMLLFLMPFNLVMAAFWTATGSWLRERIFKPEAGGVLIIVDGPRTYIRLPQYSALLWTMIAMCVVSIFSLFLFGFASHFRPSIPTSLTAFVLVLGVGAWVYLRQWRKIHSGDDDLILDDNSATIGLPETFGRTQRVLVNRSQIEKLIVEEIMHRGSKGGVSYTYAPTLRLRRNSGGIGSEKLADWSDRKKAELFSAWLTQRLHLANVPLETSA